MHRNCFGISQELFPNCQWEPKMIAISADNLCFAVQKSRFPESETGCSGNSNDRRSQKHPVPNHTQRVDRRFSTQTPRCSWEPPSGTVTGVRTALP